MGFIRGLGASAVIWTGFSGQRGSESLIDILCGKVNPSGRLADTWPIDYYDSPSAKNFINLDDNSPLYSDDGKRFGASVYYEEQEFVGYRYFDSFKKDAAYYFGRGLSYSDFSVRSSASLKAAYSASAQKSRTTPMFPERTLFSSMSKHRAGMNRDPQSCFAALKRQHF